jgi:hypothetical protein
MRVPPRPLGLISARAAVEGTSGRRRDRPLHRVDEKLTERRDDMSVSGIERTQEKGADLGFSGSKPVTRDFGGCSNMLDAEEVRGSNPLAPTM